MKTFIRFIKPEEGEPELPNYDEWEEKCYIKIHNYRELLLNDAGEIVEATASVGEVEKKSNIPDKKSNMNVGKDGGRNSQLS